MGVNNPIYISGVAMKGRPDHPQWITSVKLKYEDENGEFQDVDGGFKFDANYDKHSLVKIFFEKPVLARSIRFYPQSWHSHASARFGILRGEAPPAENVTKTEGYTIMKSLISGFSF